MKKSKSPAKRALSRSTITRKKRVSTHARPIHKRVLLHPFSAMVMLCAGILIIGSSFHSLAVSYNVTATVPAPNITAPAVIVSPGNQQHASTAPISVQGTCPAQSYVKLYRNASFSGVSQCSASLAFQIQTTVSQGANTLQARVFNVTDDEGPQSTPVVVYLDHTTLPPASVPATTPIKLSVSTIDSGRYTQGNTGNSSSTPTVSGVAPPFSDVTVTFHSDPVTCKTKADENGNWRCTLATVLPSGFHRVEVAAVTADGERLDFPDFQINVLANLASLIKPATKPILLASDYRYQVYRVGQLCSFPISIGGQGPFKVVTDWGDGTTSESSQVDGTFTLSHQYKTPNTYVVVVKATDANGDTSLLQLSAVVKGVGGAATVGAAGGGHLDGVLTWVREWLWVAWPLYIAVVLMAVSYWIGEQEAYRKLFAKRSTHHPRTARK